MGFSLARSLIFVAFEFPPFRLPLLSASVNHSSPCFPAISHPRASLSSVLFLLDFPHESQFQVYRPSNPGNDRIEYPIERGILFPLESAFLYVELFSYLRDPCAFSLVVRQTSWLALLQFSFCTTSCLCSLTVSPGPFYFLLSLIGVPLLPPRTP